MGDLNEDLEKENIEITGSSRIRGDDELDAFAEDGVIGKVAPLLDEEDELDAKVPDIPYTDKDDTI